MFTDSVSEHEFTVSVGSLHVTLVIYLEVDAVVQTQRQKKKIEAPQVRPPLR